MSVVNFEMNEESVENYVVVECFSHGVPCWCGVELTSNSVRRFNTTYYRPSVSVLT